MTDPRDYTPGFGDKHLDKILGGPLAGMDPEEITENSVIGRIILGVHEHIQTIVGKRIGEDRIDLDRLDERIERICTPEGGYILLDGESVLLVEAIVHKRSGDVQFDVLHGDPDGRQHRRRWSGNSNVMDSAVAVAWVPVPDDRQETEEGA